MSRIIASVAPMVFCDDRKLTEHDARARHDRRRLANAGSAAIPYRRSSTKRCGSGSKKSD
jgi:hypothetical protein